MPLIEQLHLKQFEATARLRSRKRKLSELYHATLNDGGHHTTRKNETYALKLQAFLEANDLEKGIAFNETTLPPRPHITFLPRHDQPTQTFDHTIDEPSNPTRGKSPAKTAAGLSPSLSNNVPSDRKTASRAKTPTEPPEPHVGVAEEADVDGLVELNGHRERAGHSTSPSHPGHSEDLDAGLVRLPLVNGKTEAGHHQYADSNNLAVPVERSVHSTNSSRRPTPDAASRPEKNRRSRSPLVLAPVSTAADPQSSPASTDGHGSSNTPAPTAGSPTTSPGDEEPPLKSLDYPSGLLTDKELTTNGTDTVRDTTTAAGATDESEPTTSTNATAPTAQDTEHSQHVVQGQGPQVDSSSHTSISRRPPMRIDTQSGSGSYFKPQPVGDIVESPGPMTSSATPRRIPAASPAEEPPKRATRISSGALQKKSVSEILGETPKTLSPQIESPLSATREGLSPGTYQSRLLEKEKREKERSKMSTVVFAKPTRTSEPSDTIELVRRANGDGEQRPPKQRDYLYSLFESRAYSPPKNASLTSLIHEAHKTVSTADHVIEYREQMNCRAMKRIYQLQNANRWPLRQLKRAEEATRPTSHWDFLLDDAKWMRIDFREERKWKLAAAQGLAEWCAEYLTSSKEEQALLRVRVSPRGRAIETSDVVVPDGPGPALSSQSTPDLIPSGEDESVSDGIIADPRDLSLANEPAAIFSLGASDFAFTIDKTPAADKLLNELPLYEPVSIKPDMSKSDLAQQMDSRWKQDIVPISRFAVEKIHFSEPQPPRKRSRYNYEQESSQQRESKPLPPKQTDVALFQPENKHMRDRIHPGHSFRPPSEHPMPTQLFFETRASSQWTHGEDDELRRLVKDYSYNWSLISSCLTPRSPFSSGADRRTPWECFERWIGLEGLPADMSKTPYFRAYHSRIEAAGRHVQAQLEAAQQRAGANVQINRKRTTQPVRVERKRTQKHLAMLDAMRKLAKKRETAIQKQQHQADLAAMRKANEANQPRPPISTPAEFSRLKHERELKMAERQEIYRQQLIAHQRATAAGARNPAGQVGGMPNGVPRSAAGLPNGVAAPGMPGVPNGNLTVPPGHQRPHPMQGMPNGMPNGVPMPPGMIGNQAQQAQMQAKLIAAARNMGSSPENQARILEQARNIAQQQQMQRQAQTQNGVHSSPSMQSAAMAGTNGVSNPAYAASLAAGGAPSPSMGLDGAAGSPRQNAMGQALSNGQIPIVSQISNQIRQQYPQISDEQVMHLTNQRLSQYSQASAAAAGGVQKQRNSNQAALNAAMGAANAGAHAANQAAAAAAVYQQHGQGMMTNEQVQQYNARMRVQQAQQRASAGANGGFVGGPMAPGAGMIGMGSSPVMNMARPVSQQGLQGPMSRSATPRENRSGSSGNAGAGMMVQGSPRNPAQGM